MISFSNPTSSQHAPRRRRPPPNVLEFSQHGRRRRNRPHALKFYAHYLSYTTKTVMQDSSSEPDDVSCRINFPSAKII